MVLKQKYLKLFYTILAFGSFFYFCQALAAPVPFLKNLQPGSNSADVKKLQQFLNSNGFVVTQKGPGSPGNESNYYGALTKSALVKFQDFFSGQILKPLGLKKGTGIFSTSTRNFVNSIQLNKTSFSPFTNLFVLNSKNSFVINTSTPSNFSGYFSGGGGGGSVNLNTPTINPTITFNSLSKTYGDASFLLSPLSDSSGNFSFLADSADVATILGSSLTITGAGTTTITALQNASGNFTSGSATTTLVVAKKNPSLYWNNSTVSLLTVEQVINGNPFPLALSINPSSDSPGGFYLASGDPALVSVDSGTGVVSILQNINASINPSLNISVGQMSTSNFNASVVSATITINNPNDCSPNPCLYGGTCGGGFDDLGTGSFSCTCANNMTGTICSVALNDCADNPCGINGVCTRTSTVGGPLNSHTCTCNSGYYGDSCQNVGVAPAPTITFNHTTTTLISASPITLSATSNSSGTITYTSSSSSVASVSGNILTINNYGQATITLTQLPTSSYSTGTATSVISVTANACASNPCQNGGTCTNVYRNTYSCNCPTGYYGFTCNATRSNCDGAPGHNTCFNGGTCKPDVGGGFCSCAVCFTGTYCDTYQADICAGFRAPQNFSPLIPAAYYTCPKPEYISN